MIDFSRAQLTHTAIHFVGNKGIGESLTLSDKPFEFKDDFVKETLLRYLLSSFKKDMYYQFKKSDVSLNSVANNAEDLFKTQEDFITVSQNIASNLYDQGMHPKIAGGNLFVCYFKDAVCDGELADCIGIFKTEKKETYLQLDQDDAGVHMEADSGININKLDKGVLIFNTDKKSGYKLSVIDANNKIAECALYWTEDFLNAEMKQNAYYHTKNFVNMVRSFAEEKLPDFDCEGREIKDVISKATRYIAEKEQLVGEEFEKEVLGAIERQEAFQEYKKEYKQRLDLVMPEEFEVSQTVVKENKKHQRYVLKLDKNFHVYVHGKSENIEQGFDEEKGMKYMKLFYINSEE